ncbi:alpha/beta fold hydrolase [Aliarcobacter lanthieri]|uniref:alpha/beta fold hydrolase n=1 Tax=Aliarcobacter lanthieri TaxID=1355374 RepID=UPI00047E48C8|nr:alpha/beta hydrolase [Aliarcobacter lanthieri]
MLNYKIRYFFILFFLFSNLFSKEFYIQESILNSQVYINIDGNIENEPIIFVHGLGDEASTIWHESVNKLKDKYYIITFDLPGFGKSSKENVEYTPEKYAKILDFLVSKFLNNREFYLVGHSMGAAITLKYATLYQEKLKKLFIIDSAGVLHKDAYGDFLLKSQINKIVDENKKSTLNNQISQIASNISSNLTSILPKDLSGVVRDETIRKKFLNTPKSIAALGLMTENWFDLYKIKTPTIILWGEDDNVTPLRTGYVLNYLLENSKLNIIKNSGHVPIIDSKDEYFKYLNDFLEQDILKEEKSYKSTNNLNRELRNNKGLLKDCSYKYLKIVDSNNLYLQNCNIQKLVVENSNIYIIDSKIGESDIAINSYNSNISITSSTIKADVGISINASKFDLAGVKIEATKKAIVSENENEIIFSLVTVKSSINSKIFHKKVVMKDKEEY